MCVQELFCREGKGMMTMTGTFEAMNHIGERLLLFSPKMKKWRSDFK